MWRRVIAMSLPRLRLILNPVKLPLISVPAQRFINSTLLQKETLDKIDEEAFLRIEKLERQNSPKRMLMLKLKHFLNCTEVEAIDLVNQNKALLKVPLENISQTIEYLFEKKVKQNTIKQNLWLLGKSTSMQIKSAGCHDTNHSNSSLLEHQNKSDRSAGSSDEGAR